MLHLVQVKGRAWIENAGGIMCFDHSTVTMADEATDLSLMMIVNTLKSILHVSGCIHKFNKRLETSIQASRKEYKAPSICALRSHGEKMCSILDLCPTAVWEHQHTHLLAFTSPENELFCSHRVSIARNMDLVLSTRELTQWSPRWKIWIFALPHIAHLVDTCTI